MPLVELFFAERIFGPMRLDKLERQLRAQQKTSRRKAKDGQRRLRDRARDLDRRIGLQIDALEKGIEPELVGQRIAELRAEKETVDAELKAPVRASPTLTQTSSPRPLRGCPT